MTLGCRVQPWFSVALGFRRSSFVIWGMGSGGGGHPPRGALAHCSALPRPHSRALVGQTPAE